MRAQLFGLIVGVASTLAAAQQPQSEYQFEVPPLAPASPRIAATQPDGFEVPEGWQPRNVRIATSAVTAAALTDEWADSGVAPLPGADGRVVVTYGSGLTTLVCAFLKVCVIELEPGEKMLGEPVLGDAVRWSVEVAAAGAPRTELIMVKPLVPDLKNLRAETSLVVTTDRRVYYVRLQSDTDKYVARLAFQYPHGANDGQNWAQFEARRAAEQQLAAEAVDQTLSEVPIVAANWDYTVKGKRALAPIIVADDGRQTYLRMPAGLANRGLPVLLVKGEVTNYRVQGDWWIVDQIFDRAELVMGTGWRQKKATVRRDS